MPWIAYAHEEHRGTLTGYGARTCSADIRLVSFDGTARRRRAGLGVAAWWSVAAATAFIPLAHLFLVPGFVAFGVYSGIRRYREGIVVLSVSGTCPDCAAEQDFEVRGGWAATMTVACGGCGRSLRLTAVEEGIAEEGLEPPTRGL